MLQKLLLSKVLFLIISWLVFTSFHGNQTIAAEKIALKVASVCMIVVQDKDWNLQKIFHFMEEAAAQGAKLVVFPEIALQQCPCWGTSSVIPTQEEIDYLYDSAETIPGESTQKLIDKAKELNIYVIFGMTEKPPDYDVLFNTSVFLGPNGILGKYRKNYLWDLASGGNEDLFYIPGTTLGVFDSPLGKISLIICADMYYDLGPILARNGADLLVTILAWPDDPQWEIDLYNRKTKENASQAHRWHVASNQVGPVSHYSCYGHSRIIDPNGNIVIDTGRAEGVIIAETDLLIEPSLLEVGVMSATTKLDCTMVGKSTQVEVTVELDTLLEDIESLLGMILDLYPLGITSELPFLHTGNGKYTASSTITPLQKGWYYLPVMVETADSSRYGLLAATLDVYPDKDMCIYEEGPGTDWTLYVSSGAESDLMSSKFVHNGSYSHAILLQSGGSAGYVRYSYQGVNGVDPFGYTHLEFYINGGDSAGQDPEVGGKALSDLEIVPQSNSWTLVSVPIYELSLNKGRLNQITITGSVKDTFYLDDMKLVVKETDPTAVGELEGLFQPSGYALAQNYPNPFNSSTTIIYSMPEPGRVILKVYDLIGREVKILVSKFVEAGTHSVNFDATNLPSGIYVYKLQAGDLMETKKMLLMR